MHQKLLKFILSYFLWLPRLFHLHKLSRHVLFMLRPCSSKILRRVTRHLPDVFSDPLIDRPDPSTFVQLNCCLLCHHLFLSCRLLILILKCKLHHGEAAWQRIQTEVDVISGVTFIACLEGKQEAFWISVHLAMHSVTRFFHFCVVKHSQICLPCVLEWYFALWLLVFDTDFEKHQGFRDYFELLCRLHYDMRVVVVTYQSFYLVAHLRTPLFNQLQSLRLVFSFPDHERFIVFKLLLLCFADTH